MTGRNLDPLGWNPQPAPKGKPTGAWTAPISLNDVAHKGGYPGGVEQVRQAVSIIVLSQTPNPPIRGVPQPPPADHNDN